MLLGWGGAFGVISAFAALTALLDSLGFIAWCAVIGFGNNLTLTSLVAALSAASHIERGGILALHAAITYAGFSPGSGHMGPVFEAYGLGGVGICSAAALVAASLLAALAERTRRRLRLRSVS